jgi:tetratricopeptide (TPR) repeat protein
MLISAVSPQASDNARWQSFYSRSVSRQMKRLIGLIEKKKKTPAALLPHFESMMALFEQSLTHPASETRAETITFVRKLHPLPIWWRKWSEWLRVLEQAAFVAKREKKYQDLTWLLLTQAEMLLSSGRAKKSRQLSKDALKTAQKHHLSEMSLRAELALFEADKYLGRVDDLVNAIALLEKSLAEKAPSLHEKTFRELQIEITLKKTDILRRQGQIDAALAYMQEAFTVAADIYDENDFFMTKLYTHRSTLYWANGEYDLSIDYRKKALRVFTLWGDQTSQIEYEGDLGLIYWSAEKHKKAEETLLASIKKAEKQHLLSWQTVQTGDLALVHLSCGRLEQAYRLHQRHLELSRLTNNYAEEKRARGNLGIAQTHRGEFQSALKNFQVNILHTKKHNLNVATGRLYLRLSWALDGLGKKDEALKYARAALETAQALADSASLTMAFRCLSELHLPLADKIRYAEQARILAKKQNRRLNEAGALITLANCTQNQSYFDQATSILKEIGAEEWLKRPPVFKSLRLPLLA